MRTRAFDVNFIVLVSVLSTVSLMDMYQIHDTAGLPFAFHFSNRSKRPYITMTISIFRSLLPLVALFSTFQISATATELVDNEKWNLSIHQPSTNLHSGIVVGNIVIKDTTASIEPVPITSNPSWNDLDKEGWCVSLLQVGDATELPCFTYLQELPLLNGNIYGELALVINFPLEEEQASISSASFFPMADEDASLSLNLQTPFVLRNPIPRLSLKGTADVPPPPSPPSPSDVTDDAVLAKKKKKKTGKPVKKVETPPANEANLDEPFQEVVLPPRGIYADKKTFIEKNWMYIAPPLVVVFILANMRAPV
jgi:hypothetical protein